MHELPDLRLSAVAGLETLSDRDLVLRSHAGDERSTEALVERYRAAARARARNYYLVGAERDDLYQEGMIGLTKAIRDFDPDHGASFAAFADLCITRQILTAVKMATRLKHVPLNSYVPIDPPADGAGDSHSVAETVGGLDDDPLTQLVNEDEFRSLMQVVDETLTGLEAEVLRLYVDGRSYQEIAGMLGRRTKSVDNAIQRIKRKLEARLRHA